MDSTSYNKPINYELPVTVHTYNQFISGNMHKVGGFLPASTYSQALDTLVVGCVDIIPVHRGRVLIGQRSWQPQPDWWCFGGRMHKGELFQIAAARNVERELFHKADRIKISPDRFKLVGVYNLIWNKRAQEPIENGCHVISITMMLPLTDEEIAHLHPNEEYRKICWIQPVEIIDGPELYHPCLVQMARDILPLISSYNFFTDLT